MVGTARCAVREMPQSAITFADAAARRPYQSFPQLIRERVRFVDFFEHRLRKEEGLREKADYILANPVRAGLVKKIEDWPYLFIADPW